MKKIVVLMLIGFLSGFSLVGCGDDGKLAGTYIWKDPVIDSEFRYILKWQGDSYKLQSQYTKAFSKNKDLEDPKYITSLTEEGNYLIRGDDNMKFIEVLNKDQIKQLNNGKIYTRIKNER